MMEKLTLAICGIKLSKWLSVSSFPCFSANSFKIFRAHKFSGNSPVAITEWRMFIVASTGSTLAIFVIIASISLVTWAQKNKNRKKSKNYLHSQFSIHRLCMRKFWILLSNFEFLKNKILSLKKWRKISQIFALHNKWFNLENYRSTYFLSMFIQINYF